MDIKQLTNDISVCAYQLLLEDVKLVAGKGFATIVNNRPDGEVEGQPSSAQIKEACQSLGLEYYYLPVVSSNLTIDDVYRYREVFKTCAKPVFAYCRTGTRSTTLWGLMQASLQQELYSPEIIHGAAKNAGYDLSNINQGLNYLYTTQEDI